MTIWLRLGRGAALTVLVSLGLPACVNQPSWEAATAAAALPASRLTFTNPLLPSGPDPWVTREGSTYYYMHTLGDRLAIWKTRDITNLANAERKTIWTPPAKGRNAVSI